MCGERLAHFGAHLDKRLGDAFRNSAGEKGKKRGFFGTVRDPLNIFLFLVYLFTCYFSAFVLRFLCVQLVTFFAFTCLIFFVITYSYVRFLCVILAFNHAFIF